METLLQALLLPGRGEHAKRRGGVCVHVRAGDFQPNFEGLSLTTRRSPC